MVAILVNEVSLSSLHVVRNINLSAISSGYFFLIASTHLLTCFGIRSCDGNLHGIVSIDDIELHVFALRVIARIGCISRAIAPTGTIEGLNINSIDTFVQILQRLVDIKHLLIELSSRITHAHLTITVSSPSPTVLFVISVAGVLNEHSRHVCRIIRCCIDIVIRSNSLLNSSNSLIQLGLCALGIVVNLNLCRHINIGSLSLIENSLQLHGHIIDIHLISISLHIETICRNELPVDESATISSVVPSQNRVVCTFRTIKTNKLSFCKLIIWIGRRGRETIDLILHRRNGPQEVCLIIIVDVHGRIRIDIIDEPPLAPIP